jgi:hypothetical protein
MTEQQQNLQRVFIHELGHFVIKLIAFKHFGIREVERVIFIPRGEDFEGRIFPKIPPGADRGMPTVNHAEKIIDLEYGCFFETFYYSASLESCWSPQGHGNEDQRFWEEEVQKFRAGAREELIELRSAHQKQIIDTGLLEYVKQLDVQDYLVPEKPYEVDIKKLSEVVESLHKSHEEIVLAYIGNVKEILKK